MQQLATKDGALTAVRTGTGRDLVLVHSLLTDRQAFDAVIPELARHFRVTLLNLPGFHGSRPVGGDLAAYARSIAAAFDDLAIARDAILLGNGFGGTVCLAFALDHPGRIGKLVLCDVAAGFPEAGKQAFRVMAQKVSEGGMAAIAEIAAKRVYHDAYVAAHPHVIGERRAVLMEVDPTAFRAACNALVDADLMPRLPALRVPTLVIYGALDQATPPALNRLIGDAVPTARQIEIPDCGHCPPLEQPATFLRAIEPFLKG